MDLLQIDVFVDSPKLWILDKNHPTNMRQNTLFEELCADWGLVRPYAKF